MPSITMRGALLATIGTSALVAGCHGDAAAPNNAAPLSAQQAVQVGTQLASELGRAITSLGAGAVGGFALVASPSLERVASALAGTPCPTPDNVADADHDGIPDNATITFALPQCRTVVNGDTTEITGVVHLSDPVFSPPPDVRAFGYQATIANLVTRVRAANADSSFTDTRNGAMALVAGSTGMAQEHAVDVVRLDKDGRSHLASTWHATFTAAVGASFTIGGPLPHGLFAAQGTTAWERGDVSRQFAIATTQPLEVDPTCADTSPNRIRAGEVRAVVAGAGSQAFVRIVFRDCLAPTITFQAGG